ncbi:MAG: TOTE conflict system archaeo-eukaryotic primase domain-containing protein [Methylocella sp.]
MHSPIQAKIALFRRLFQGRRDVFPVRWENVKSGRNGCSPACRNKWRRGVCNGRWSAHAMASLPSAIPSFFTRARTFDSTLRVDSDIREIVQRVAADGPPACLGSAHRACSPAGTTNGFCVWRC